MQFRSRGRLRVMRRICGEGKERIACCGSGGDVLKGIVVDFVFLRSPMRSNAGEMKGDFGCC